MGLFPITFSLIFLKNVPVQRNLGLTNQHDQDHSLNFFVYEKL
ncbi:hypothetical protein MMC2321_03878 [Chitinophaga sp. MM2321]